MPWRPLCELSRHLGTAGHDVTLLSLGDRNGEVVGENVPDQTISIDKHRHRLETGLLNIIRDRNTQILVWPVAWREPGWRLELLGKVPCAIVCYFPGGVYSLRASIYAARWMNFRAALPYMAESVIRKRRLLGRLRSLGVRHLVALSAFTREVIRDNGWPNQNVHAIPPGKDEGLDLEVGELPPAFSEWINGRPFVLFTGPPDGIRGVYQLLDAFKRASKKNEDICLVCLFRSDDRLDSEPIERCISRNPAANRIYTVWSSVDRETLNAFIDASQALALPFLLVPSEIPLAIIEAIALKKPVITAGPNGTSKFVDKFGLSARVGDVSALADALIKAVEDRNWNYGSQLRAAAIFSEMGNWAAMSEQWSKVLNEAMALKVAQNSA